MLEYLLHILLLQQRTGGVPWRAEICEFYSGIVRQRGRDGGHIELEAGSLKRDFHEGDIIDLGGDAVHAVGGRAGEDLVLSGDAEGAEEGVDGFIGANAYKEVVGGEGLRGVSVRVAEVAEVLLEFDLVAAYFFQLIWRMVVSQGLRVGVSIQAEQVDVNRCAESV